MLRTDALDYTLPEELIATAPASPRDTARLLVVSRADPSLLEHRLVRDLPTLLQPGDLMVVNATRVLPARFEGVRADTGGGVEGLYLGPAAPGPAPHWNVLLKMRRTKPGVTVHLHDHAGRDSGVRLILIERADDDHAGWIVRVESTDTSSDPVALLDRIGLTPVPPYILAARKRTHADIADDRDRSTYQTVYATARDERPGFGSVAAPTAGLHFTPELLAALDSRGVRRADVTLDVGLGTFKPVETEFLEQHPMHAEWCHVPPATARAIAGTRAAGGRVLAIGTTAARTLESFDSPAAMLERGTHETRLLITPGYRFKHLDALLTNFHLPRSTLLAMVGAFLTAPNAAEPSSGLERLRSIYDLAIRERYRFYSYGDAMLILP